MEDKQKQDIEYYSGLFISPEDIIIILGIDASAKDSKDFKDAYHKGRLISIASVHASVLELAKNGSSPAQILAVKFIDDSKTNDMQL